MRIPLSAQILVGMVLGLIFGLAIGPDAASFGEIGKWVIQLVKAIAAPMLFLFIVQSILKADMRLRDGARMIVIATCNATIALCIGLGLSNLLQPGKYLSWSELSGIGKGQASVSAPAAQKIEFLRTFSSYVPSSLVQPFAENAIISLVLLAILLGAGLRRVRHAGSADARQGFETLGRTMETLLEVLSVVLAWIIKLVPLAVFGVVAKAVGEYGFAPLKGLAVYMAVGLAGLVLHCLISYQILIAWVAKIPLRVFWREAREPMIYAVGVNSSLATLPVTLRALDRLKISKSAASLGACVGTNLNNDGIILYEAMAVLFVAQAHGIHLSLGQQLLAAASCMVAAMGIAGIPEAGFVSLALVLATVGLPAEILPLLMTVDWVIARGRSVVNVLSDMVVSILLDRTAPRA